MRIELNQDEIYTAIKAYIPDLGINIENKSVDVSLLAGRGSNGISASVEILTSPPKTKRKQETVIEPDPVKEIPVEDSEQDEPAASDSLFN